MHYFENQASTVTLVADYYMNLLAAGTSGVWTAWIHILCGACGILASRRWFISYQIIVFLVASMASSTASIVCMYMTTIGIYQKINYEDVYYGTLGLRLKYEWDFFFFEYFAWFFLNIFFCKK